VQFDNILRRRDGRDDAHALQSFETRSDALRFAPHAPARLAATVLICESTVQRSAPLVRTNIIYGVEARVQHLPRKAASAASATSRNTHSCTTSPRPRTSFPDTISSTMSAIGPFPLPAEGKKPAAPPVLTADQQKKYDELLTTVKSWSTLPKTSAKGAEEEALSDLERMWLTRECLLRYLRAAKWSLPNATQRLRDTVIWRREYGTDRFTADYISEENATGKLCFASA
jgi:hypothetical protein